ERPIVSTPERAYPVQTRISPSIFFVVVPVLVVIRRVRFRPWLIGAPHPEHFRVPVTVDGLEVAGAFRYVQEVGMLVVGEYVLGAKAIPDYRRRIVLLAKRHACVDLPQIVISIIKIGGIEADYVSVLVVVVEQHREIVPVSIKDH